MDGPYLFSRSVGGETIDFYKSRIPGVHIKNGCGTVSELATVADIERAILLACSHAKVLPIRPLTLVASGS